MVLLRETWVHTFSDNWQCFRYRCFKKAHVNHITQDAIYPFLDPKVYCKGLPGESGQSSPACFLLHDPLFCGGGSGTQNTEGILDKCSTTQLHTQPQSKCYFLSCYFSTVNSSFYHGAKEPECNFQISQKVSLCVNKQYTFLFLCSLHSPFSLFLLSLF